jgi:hypothetical protein
MKSKNQYQLAELTPYDVRSDSTSDMDCLRSFVRRSLAYLVCLGFPKVLDPISMFIISVLICCVWRFAGKHNGFVRRIFEVSAVMWVVSLLGVSGDLLGGALFFTWVLLDVIPFFRDQKGGAPKKK